MCFVCSAASGLGRPGVTIKLSSPGRFIPRLGWFAEPLKLVRGVAYDIRMCSARLFLYLELFRDPNHKRLIF